MEDVSTIGQWAGTKAVAGKGDAPPRDRKKPQRKIIGNRKDETQEVSIKYKQGEFFHGLTPLQERLTDRFFTVTDLYL
jgi:hypothetical protein